MRGGGNVNLFTSVLGMWSADVGIDLGTANTLVHVRGRGIVLDEPSVVAVSKRTGQVLAVGTEARRMLGRTPADIIATRPLRNGVIADFEHAEQMLRHFIARAHNRAWHVSAPRVVIGIPSGVTEVEKRAVTDAATMAGAREAHLVEEPMAAAIGAGLPIQAAGGSMIVDIGGGTTEVAVISLGGVVAATSARIGGDGMDDAIVQYVRRNMGLLIGERTAEDIKMAMGSAFPIIEERPFLVRGRDLMTGLPKTVEMTTAHVREALAGVLIDIVRAVRSTLDATPPELVEDIMERGLVVCGGGALLMGLDKLLAHETLMPVRVAEDPLTCVVRGTGIVLEQIDTLNRVLLRTRRVRALRY
jgi:rod shape-determining protein MreB